MMPTSSQASSLFCAAVITSAHGVHGHVKVKCFLEDPSRFKAYSPYSNEEGDSLYAVKKVLSFQKDILVVAFEGVTDRNQAEGLRGAKLMVAQERLPHLMEGTYYHRDLMGLAVQSSKGQTLGTVNALYNFGAGDLLEVKTGEGVLHMLPFTHEMVPEIDLENRLLRLSDAADVFLEGDAQ
jgi:16S rRNA processing protein RimM